MDQAPNPTAGKTLRYWLGQALQEVRRTRIGLSPEQIAPATRRSNKVIRRIEGGQGKGVSEHVDALLAIYAELASMDPLEIIELALQRWREHGERPDLPPDYDKIRPYLLHSMEADVERAVERPHIAPVEPQNGGGPRGRPDTPDNTRHRVPPLPHAS
jgi:hypothetical protein